MNLAIGILLFIVGNIFAWFQFNSQFVWEWWRDRPFTTVFIYAIPTALCYLYGAKYAYMDTGEAWAGRLLAFGASYLVFPLLTWWLLKERMFTPKTLTCVILSVMIMVVQFTWVTKS